MKDRPLKYGTNNIPNLSNKKIIEHETVLIGDYNSGLLYQLQDIDVADFAENYLKLDFHYTNLSYDCFIREGRFFVT